MHIFLLQGHKVCQKHPILSGAHIQNNFGGVSHVLGPTFVVFVFDKKSQLYTATYLANLALIY
jgi:hypothetical protein